MHCAVLAEKEPPGQWTPALQPAGVRVRRRYYRRSTAVNSGRTPRTNLSPRMRW